MKTMLSRVNRSLTINTPTLKDNELSIGQPRYLSQSSCFSYSYEVFLPVISEAIIFDGHGVE